MDQSTRVEIFQDVEEAKKYLEDLQRHYQEFPPTPEKVKVRNDDWVPQRRDLDGLRWIHATFPHDGVPEATPGCSDVLRWI